MLNKKITVPAMGTESLILIISLFFSLFCNQNFWAAMSHGRDLQSLHTLILLLTWFCVLTALHCILLGLIVHRKYAKALLMVLLFTTAAVVYFMNKYAVFFDASMFRNILRTDVKESKELLTWHLVEYLFLYGLLPSIAIAFVPLKIHSWKKALLHRCVFLILAVSLAVLGIASSFQELSSMMRNHKEIRYLITPGNYLVALLRVVSSDTRQINKKREAIGLDAKLSKLWSQRTANQKPVVLVVVVGETARAANWGLNGYDRNTTPELAKQDIINFKHVTSCGTNTEVSVPCMFSPWGRRLYDEDKIRGSESLLHVLQRAGFEVIWRDNQAGCKGVCAGLIEQNVSSAKDSKLCDGERCFDEILLQGLAEHIQSSAKNKVIVLHQLGNHGPAYYRRYPPEFKHFTPTCDSDDLGQCSQQQIVNSYDNALLYTDHFLTQTLKLLQTQSTHDAALLYVSDHGESLGEKGIYLHGIPYRIAPKEQTQVPMVLWLSDNFAKQMQINVACIRTKNQEALSHDYLFHSVLGMLNVQTKIHDANYDFSYSCRVK